MRQDDAKPWPPWRTKRLMDILEQKALGKNDEAAGQALLKPISRATVSRELNSPQAAEVGRSMRARAGALVWTLVDRQLLQIENDQSLKPGSRLNFRQQLLYTLSGLVPKQIEQKVTGKVSQEVKMLDVNEEDLVSVVGPVVKELMAREARGADSARPEESPEEPVD